MFLFSIKSSYARTWAAAVMLAWFIVFSALFVKLPLIISIMLACGACYLNVRYSKWLCAHEDEHVFINAFAKEHAFPSSPQNDRATFNVQLAGFLILFCVPLVFAHVASLENSQLVHSFGALFLFAFGVFFVTGVIHAFVRRLLF
ncbi:hypothetical protein [Aliiroseovarius sp. 2305UL8-7]|uniref:hypothetical protein n=1 Tax=Aliiroseovarius conchicola TaxID=3121637 RepID=UPI0035297F57